MASIFNFSSRYLINRIALNGHKYFCLRCLSTGNRDKASSTAVSTTKDKSVQYEIPDFSKPLENKNWVSYGFDYENLKEDRLKMHTSLFLAISIVIVYGTLFFVYMPDYKHRHWAQREAFIRLHERERQGLDPIDCNYVDPSKIILPTDEELGDTEIVI